VNDHNFLDKNRRRRSNPVARNLNQFNRPRTHKSARDLERELRYNWRSDREIADAF
jgi:hypothetical protein